MTDERPDDQGRGRLAAIGGRRGLNLLRRAVQDGWPISDEVRRDAPAILEEIMRSTVDDRSRLKALEIIRGMAKDNVEAAAILDRVERLEAGENTENASVTVRFVNQINGRD
jgi:hypothetical protein